ncbi:MAG TPA: energy-coupling factor transporter transmembrane component T [Anaerolineae bacterium]|nr:energy-coupling factor transporter transmembrane component T [Anaerolineae bacterium]
MAKINVINFMTNVERDSWVHRLDPRTKIMLLVFFTTVPLLFTDWRFSLFFILLTLPLWLTANIDYRPMAGPFAGAGFFLLIVFFFNAVRGPGELTDPNPGNAFTWYRQLGPVVVTSHTFAQGFYMAMRLVTSFTIGLLVISTTDPTYLAKGMKRLKMPTAIVFMVLAGLRFIPIVMEQLFNILDAQTIRGVSNSRIERTKLLILPLFITSLRRVRALGLATEAKGFGASRWNDFYERLRLGWLDKAILVALLVLLLASLVVRFGLGIGGSAVFDMA